MLVMISTQYLRMAPWGQQSERRLATTSCNDYEANWNRQTGRQTDRRTGGQDHVLSQADALTKNEDDLKNEDDPKNEYNLKDEDDLKNKTT